MDDDRVANGIRFQAEHCRRNDASITGRIVEAQLALMHGDTACGQRIANWPGLPLEDAMPLRLAAGFHHLQLTGDDARALGLHWSDDELQIVGRGVSGAVLGKRVVLRDVQLGDIRATNIEAAIIPDGLPVSLLGQSFLSKAQSVNISNNKMVLD